MNNQLSAYDGIIILDFGSQYTQLIARCIREAKVYCQILPHDASLESILSSRPKGIILSGGPASIYDKSAPRLSYSKLEDLGCPILGICYGMQMLVAECGGEVHPSKNREYGYARLFVTEPDSPIFKGVPVEMDVWMSHGDQVTEVPRGYRITARTENALNAIENLSKCIFGVQFHPEVAHTRFGNR